MVLTHPTERLLHQNIVLDNVYMYPASFFLFNAVVFRVIVISSLDLCVLSHHTGNSYWEPCIHNPHGLVEFTKI